MYDKFKKYQNSEKGFTILEVILSLFIVSITAIVLLTTIYETNRMDRFSKENKLTATLIDSYVSYYSDLKITEKNLNVVYADIGQVNLMDNYRDSLSVVDKELVKTFQDLEVICSNRPEITNDERYLVNKFYCEQNGRKINKGKPFIIKKYINKG